MLPFTESDVLFLGLRFSYISKRFWIEDHQLPEQPQQYIPVILVEQDSHLYKPDSNDSMTLAMIHGNIDQFIPEADSMISTDLQHIFSLIRTIM